MSELARTRVVLAGHGSRSDAANAALESLAGGLARDLELPVAAAFLEMAAPDIPSALRSAAEAGAERVVLVPFFLSPGMHVRRDLVAIVARAREELGMTIELAEFFGAHREVPRILVELTRAALGEPDVGGGERAADGPA